MLVFFRRRDSESVPAVFAAYSGVRRVQEARPLSRLLVLDPPWTAVSLSASVETESRARIRRQILPEDLGRDRNILRRDGRRHEKSFRSHLLDRIRSGSGRKGPAQIRS